MGHEQKSAKTFDSYLCCDLVVARLFHWLHVTYPLNLIKVFSDPIKHPFHLNATGINTEEQAKILR